MVLNECFINMAYLSKNAYQYNTGKILRQGMGIKIMTQKVDIEIMTINVKHGQVLTQRMDVKIMSFPRAKKLKFLTVLQIESNHFVFRVT